jgi:uncharacterized protein (UPF0332 family)
MIWKKLVEKGELRPKTVSPKEVDGVLAKARKLLKAASIMAQEDIDEAAFKEAYDAMMLAARALIYSLGYKPRTIGSHTIVMKFLEYYFGENISSLISRFKKMKEKRNYLIYGLNLFISKTEGRNAIISAKDFLKALEEEILKARKQKKLF